MPSAARISIFAFGLTAGATGIRSLIFPDTLLETLNLPTEATPAARAMALAAFAMGVYYSLATYQNNTAFFAATVPVRLLTAIVCWAQGWKTVSVWEGGCAILTGLALAWDWNTVAKASSKRE